MRTRAITLMLLILAVSAFATTQVCVPESVFEYQPCAIFDYGGSEVPAEDWEIDVTGADSYTQMYYMELFFGSVFSFSFTGTSTIQITMKACGHDNIGAQFTLQLSDDDGYHYIWEYFDQWEDVSFCDFPGCTVTNIEPVDFQLSQNYPNPFNPTTVISYSVTQPAHTSLNVFNMMGENVATLFEGDAAVGEHTATFDATNLPSGIYFYTLVSGSNVATRKMVVLK